MDEIKSVTAYLCKNYPHKHELSKARLTKLVYLADWVSALVDGKQLTNIKWIFNHYGPYVDDVLNSVKSDPQFKIEHDQTPYGTDKYLISYLGDDSSLSLSERQREILDAVINKTKTMYFNDFIDYIYSTYPVRAKERYSSLDLEDLANQYRALRKQTVESKSVASN